MQKSQQGLLQSLLREICGQCEDLVPIVCPFRWQRYHEIGATWTRQELSEAFKKLSEQRLLSLKFCFFVDGVDEYDGEDHTHIINVLKSLDASPSVKICLSSRPWNIFVKAFGTNSHQRLLLEDHNEYDIQQYVKNKFQEDEQFAIFQSKEPRSSDLVGQIVQNAQGVFLWVRIVVGNLLRGLSNDDNLSDLQRRLHSLPTTLTAYFRHMFDNIDDFYREETAEILLICLEGIQPLSLLAFWFYERERVEPNYALRADRTPFIRADVVAVFESVHKRLNARGQDLLEIEADAATVEDLMFTVRFSHLAVKEFLSRPDMLKRLHSWKSKHFDARISLSKATLGIVKLSNFPPWADINDYEKASVMTNHAGNPVMSNSERANRCWNYVSDFFSYAHLIEHHGGTLDDPLIDEFRSVVCLILVQKAHRPGTFAYLTWAIDHWACWINQYDTLPLTYDRSTFLSPFDRDMTSFFFTSAVQAKLKTHVAHKLAASPHLISRSFSQRPVLDRALRPSPWTKPTYRIDPNMIDLLLTRGANPNMILTLYKDMSKSHLLYTSEKAWTTVWALFLQNLHDAARARIRKPPELVQDEIEATKLMIEHGAAADLRPWRISGSEDSLKHFGGTMLTPSEVLREAFPPRDAIFLEQLLKKNRSWALRQACDWVKRTVLLWFYRSIEIFLWPLTSLLFSKNKVGVILLMVFIPMSIYGLSLVWPAAWLTVSGTALVLLPALILSDWIPILDWLVSRLIGVFPRCNLSAFIDGHGNTEILFSRVGHGVEKPFEDPEEPIERRIIITGPDKAIMHRMTAMNKDKDEDI